MSNITKYPTDFSSEIPHYPRQGHYEEVGAAIGRLVDTKNKAYGKSFENLGALLTILYPDGIMPNQYQDLGAMIRILDKFFRIATKKNAFGESPWTDVAGYAILMNKDYGMEKGATR